MTIPSKKHLRWAAFLRNAGPEQAVQVLKDLKLDNDTINRVRILIQWLKRRICEDTESMESGGDKPSIRRVMSIMEAELFDDLLEMKLALQKAEGEHGEEGIPETYDQLLSICRQTEEIRRDGDCIRLKDLAVTGHDIMEAGIKPGKEVGAVLAYLFDLVLEDPSRNQKEYLLSKCMVNRGTCNE